MSSTLRVGALDALRGLAVLGMVLSGSIGFGGQLPSWMYHAQVPPPLHKYDAAKALLMPGITWVDLVFPAFLFAMGAAIPLAARSLAWSEAAWGVLRRAALLLCFALFTEHMKAAHLAAAPQPAWVHGVSLLSFLLLGLALTRIVPRWARLLAVVAALGLALALPFTDGKGFRPQRQDIILVVLANMALFAGLLWIATRRWPAARWATCAGVVAVMLAPPDTWTRALLDSSPATWAYRFAYLKYLLILVPGLAVGEWLAQEPGRCEPSSAIPMRTLGLLAAALVLINLVCLYSRDTVLGFIASALAVAAGVWLLQRRMPDLPHWIAHTWRLGSLLLLLGLLMEPWQGGIRKDPSTFSYQIVGAALSMMLLIALHGFSTLKSHTAKGWMSALQGTGRNPLLAYVAGTLVVLPLLHLAGLHAAWSALNTSPASALLKGVLFTGAVLGITLLANRYKCVWRV